MMSVEISKEERSQSSQTKHLGTMAGLTKCVENLSVCIAVVMHVASDFPTYLNWRVFSPKLNSCAHLDTSVELLCLDLQCTSVMLPAHCLLLPASRRHAKHFKLHYHSFRQTRFKADNSFNFSLFKQKRLRLYLCLTNEAQHNI